ncbi:MAG: hypothetical protein ACI4WG_02065 [Erysipelotrichaceae bacterium]
MQELLRKIFQPNKYLGFGLFNFSFALLIYVFISEREKTALAYLSYFLSAYALAVFCLWFYQVCRFGNNRLKSSKIYAFYRKNNLTVIKGSIYLSLTINFIYGLFEMVIGIYYQSWWFITLACYYLLLWIMKISIVKDIRLEVSHNLIKEYRKLKSTGSILLLLNIILIGMVILIVHQNKQISYAGFLIYIVALYDFYLIITAAVNVVKYRNNHNPLLTASKCVNLTVAMISMISLEVAMVSQFGNDDAKFKLLMTALMGVGICLINSLMAIYMIVKAQNNLNKIQ